MRWAARYRRLPILRGVSASQIRADHVANQLWINARDGPALPSSPQLRGEAVAAHYSVVYFFVLRLALCRHFVLNQTLCTNAPSDLPSAAINEQFDTCDKTGVIRPQKQRALAISSTFPIRPIGMVDTIRAMASAGCPSISGVSVGPGLITLDRILRSLRSEIGLSNMRVQFICGLLSFARVMRERKNPMRDCPIRLLPKGHQIVRTPSRKIIPHRRRPSVFMVRLGLPSVLSSEPGLLIVSTRLLRRREESMWCSPMVRQFGNVSLNARDITANCCFHGLVVFLLTTARDEDIGALLYEELCGSQSYPGCATRYYCHFTLQLFRSCHRQSSSVSVAFGCTQTVDADPL
jgi:hypothetical protein